MEIRWSQSIVKDRNKKESNRRGVEAHNVIDRFVVQGKEKIVLEGKVERRRKDKID